MTRLLSVSRLQLPFKARTLQRRLAHGLSSVRGADTPPLDLRTLPDFWDDVVSTRQHRTALICPSEPASAHGGPSASNGDAKYLSWSYQAFDDHIKALARGLVSLGVRKGDRIGVIMGNNSAYATLQWACARVGAILVTINPAYRTQELIRTLAHVGVSRLFMVPNLRSSAYLEMLHDALPGLRSAKPNDIAIEGLPALRGIVLVDNTRDSARFAGIMGGAPAAVDFRDVLLWNPSGPEARVVEEMRASLHRDDVVNLQFTSGTTGLPKAVSLTHSNLLNNALSVSEAMRLTQDDVLCNVPPLFHCFGLVLGNLAAWSRGACIVYPSETFSPAAIVDAIAEQRCTALHGVPTHFNGVLAEVERRQKAGETLDFSRLRTGIAAGSPVPIELMRQLIKTMNLRELTNAYGMTETSPVSFQTVTDDPLLARTETVGRVRPHVRAEIIDEHGAVVPVGVRGELRIAGYLVQKGYWGDSEHTDQVMRRDSNGTLWMHTGDEAVLDEDGYLRIVGRIKDLIIRGGENLSPIAIENALVESSDIVEAAAIAVPDATYGEVVGVWIVLRPDAKTPSKEDICAWVRARMNPQNVPAWVWFAGVDGPAELPRTASGKVQKHVLRDLSPQLRLKQAGRVVVGVQVDLMR